MVQAISFDGYINKDSTNALLNNINELIMLSKSVENLKVILYYSSEGGEVYWANYQIDFLNRALEHFNLEIYTGGIIMSAAVKVVDCFKGVVHVDELTVGMIHQISSSIESKSLNNKNSFDSFILKQNRKDANKSFLRYKIFFTDDEIVLYDKGSEIYFDSNRLIKILNNKKTIVPEKPAIKVKSNKKTKTKNATSSSKKGI